MTQHVWLLWEHAANQSDVVDVFATWMAADKVRRKMEANELADRAKNRLRVHTFAGLDDGPVFRYDVTPREVKTC